jgi:hypothetical protein
MSTLDVNTSRIRPSLAIIRQIGDLPSSRFISESIDFPGLRDVYSSYNIVDPSLDLMFDEIDILRSLKPDWDGNGARTVSTNTVNKTRRFIRLCVYMSQSCGVAWARPSIAPTASGGIRLLWDDNDNAMRVISDPRKDEVACILDKPGHEPQMFNSTATCLAQVLLFLGNQMRRL